jgi:hypothetical protein
MKVLVARGLARGRQARPTDSPSPLQVFEKLLETMRNTMQGAWLRRSLDYGDDWGGAGEPQSENNSAPIAQNYCAVPMVYTT